MEQEKAAQAETVINIPLSELYPFPNQPFKVRDDEEMQKMVESVKECGIITPAAVRSRIEGGYEIIAGHRRKRACELAGVNFLPAVVRDLDDDTATIFMVDSNLQREDVLPSEKAQAYKMKLDAMRRRAGRPSKENSVQLGQNFQGMTSRELLAENSPDSSTQIQRFIRLTELSSELQKMVDDGNIAMTTAVELSYLKAEEQTLLVEANVKRACVLWEGCRLCALSVWLVAQHHFQFYHCNPNLLLTSWTVKRKFHKDSIFIHLCPRFSPANGAANPSRTICLVTHCGYTSYCRPYSASSARLWPLVMLRRVVVTFNIKLKSPSLLIILQQRGAMPKGVLFEL